MLEERGVLLRRSGLPNPHRIDAQFDDRAAQEMAFERGSMASLVVRVYSWAMFEWVDLSSTALWWIAIASVTMFVLALIAAPLLIIRIPANYFAHTRRSKPDYPTKHQWLRWVWLIAKNVIGVVFLFLGVLMLVLPGQGILTILIGVALLDFPGKFWLQRWIITRRGVLGSVNWVRHKAGKQDLILEQ